MLGGIKRLPHIALNEQGSFNFIINFFECIHLFAFAMHIFYFFFTIDFRLSCLIILSDYCTLLPRGYSVFYARKCLVLMYVFTEERKCIYTRTAREYWNINWKASI